MGPVLVKMSVTGTQNDFARYPRRVLVKGLPSTEVANYLGLHSPVGKILN